MSTITLVTGEGVRPLDIDGLTLDEALEEALGYEVELNQVRVNGQEFLGDFPTSVPDGAVVQVLNADVALKGVSGA